MTSPAPDIFSVVSVDVVAVRHDRATGRVLFGAAPRTAPPYEGELALPGVVVRSGERLGHAAARALEKLGREELRPTALGQLRTFDEPSRDPRGPSLSVAMWAAYPPLDGDLGLSGGGGSDLSGGVWFPLDDPPHLAFDHDRIVAESREILAERLWRDLELTRALTGPELTATDAVHLTGQLTGRAVHRANLNRDLARLPGLEEAGTGPATGGRPPKLWRWA